MYYIYIYIYIQQYLITQWSIVTISPTIRISIKFINQDCLVIALFVRNETILV